MKETFELKKDSVATNKEISNNRFFELDVFRGLAALGVVLFHYTTIYNNNYQHSSAMNFYFVWGRHGVGIFFIISVFVIFMTLERTKKSLDFIVSGYVTIRELYKFNVHPYLSIAIAIFISITLATIVTLAIEQPTLRFLRAKYRQSAASK